ncbi:MAG: hypothetical protein ACRCX8_18555 [Sarcina sp.]
MNLEQVKELVNLKVIAESFKTESTQGFFEEDVEIMVKEHNHDVYLALRKGQVVDDEVVDYLDKLQMVIREALIKTIQELEI